MGETKKSIEQSSPIKTAIFLKVETKGGRRGSDEKSDAKEKEKRKKYVTCCWHGRSHRVEMLLCSQMRLWHMHEPLTPDLSHRASISSLPHPLCAPLSSQSSVVSSTLNQKSSKTFPNSFPKSSRAALLQFPASCRIEISRRGIKEFWEFFRRERETRTEGVFWSNRTLENWRCRGAR